MKLFFTGFLQTIFVVINVYLISKEYYIGVFLSAFMISFIWSWNVKRIAFGTRRDRIFYALGAATGSTIGLLLSIFLIKPYIL